MTLRVKGTSSCRSKNTARHDRPLQLQMRQIIDREGPTATEQHLTRQSECQRRSGDVSAIRCWLSVRLGLCAAAVRSSCSVSHASEFGEQT